jgi:hypothetical protein
MSGDEAEVDVVVSVSDEHLDHLDDVVSELRAAGLHVHETLGRLGTVIGSVPSAQLSSLSDIEGVASVEPDREYRLPPPDSDVQ